MRNVFKSFRQDTAVFIDAANLFYAQKTLGIEIDYRKLYQFLHRYKRLVTIRIYLAYDHQSKKEQQFINSLKKIGYVVICKKLKVIRKDDETVVKKGNLDIELALDAFELCNKYRTIILFSGDSDFETLLKRLKKRGKRCIVFSVRGHISRELSYISNKYFELDLIKEKIKARRR